MANEQGRRHAAWDAAAPYQVFMLLLCIFALLALGAQAALPADGEAIKVLAYTDTAICVVFLLDFFWSLYHAPNRMRYLVTWGWVDLISSIPVVGPLRLGRVGRVVRILRVLRGLRAARTIAMVILTRRAQSAFLATLLIASLLVVSCSIAVLHFETGADGNIRSAEDAIWWAMTTVTTVGYGDRFPVTPEGRIVAAFLMIAGVSVFATLSGLIASWMLAPTTRESDTDLRELRAQLAELNSRLDQLRA